MSVRKICIYAIFLVPLRTYYGDMPKKLYKN